MVSPLDLPETYTTTAITVSIARSTSAGFQAAPIHCLKLVMANTPRPKREADIIINFLLPSINYSNEYPQELHAHHRRIHPPLSRGRRILAAAPRSDMIYLIF